MTSPSDTPNPGSPVRPDASSPDEEVVPDYSRLGFRDLRKLCTARDIPADGTVTQLIEKLKAADAAKGLEVDDVPDDDEFDLLGDEPGPPTAAGEAASPPAAVRPSASDDLAGPAVDVPPEVGTTPAMPAVRVVAAEGETGALPPATVGVKGNRPNLNARTGLVKVGESHGAAEVRGFRWEFVVGSHELTDADHFRYIAETHAQAAAQGLATKGGITVGERVGFSADADGRRTAIYQVPLKRVR